MKVVKSVIWFGCCLLVFLGCKPSDRYVGEWYALSAEGEQVMIHFSKDKEMTITDHTTEHQETFSIGQTGGGIVDSMSYYAILIDGASYFLVFENRKDESNAILIKQTNFANEFEHVVGDIVYRLNRKDFPVSD